MAPAGAMKEEISFLTVKTGVNSGLNLPPIPEITLYYSTEHRDHKTVKQDWPEP